MRKDGLTTATTHLIAAAKLTNFDPPLPPFSLPNCASYLGICLKFCSCYYTIVFGVHFITGFFRSILWDTFLIRYHITCCSLNYDTLAPLFQSTVQYYNPHWYYFPNLPRLSSFFRDLGLMQHYIPFKKLHNSITFLSSQVHLPRPCAGSSSRADR